MQASLNELRTLLEAQLDALDELARTLPAEVAQHCSIAAIKVDEALHCVRTAAACLANSDRPKLAGD